MTRRGAGGCYEQGRGRKEEGGGRRRDCATAKEKEEENKKREIPGAEEAAAAHRGYAAVTGEKESLRLGQGCRGAGGRLVLNLRPSGSIRRENKSARPNPELNQAHARLTFQTSLFLE